jgi:GTP pyrophosphokinase
LANTSTAIAEEGANITSAQVRTGEGKALHDFEIEIKDLDQLNRIIQAIRRVKGVDSVVRVKTIYPMKEDSTYGKGTA